MADAYDFFPDYNYSADPMAQEKRPETLYTPDMLGTDEGFSKLAGAGKLIYSNKAFNKLFTYTGDGGSPEVTNNPAIAALNQDKLISVTDMATGRVLQNFRASQEGELPPGYSKGPTLWGKQTYINTDNPLVKNNDASAAAAKFIQASGASSPDGMPNPDVVRQQVALYQPTRQALVDANRGTDRPTMTPTEMDAKTDEISRLLTGKPFKAIAGSSSPGDKKAINLIRTIVDSSLKGYQMPQQQVRKR